MQSADKLRSLIGNLAVESIKDLSADAQGITIANNFG